VFCVIDIQQSGPDDYNLVCVLLTVRNYMQYLIYYTFIYCNSYCVRNQHNRQEAGIDIYLLSYRWQSPFGTNTNDRVSLI